MPMLRPALRPGQRSSVDWMTGELVQWQSEGWLEAQHADEWLRAHRAARRSEVGVLVAELVAGLVTGVGVAARGLVVAARRLSLDSLIVRVASVTRRVRWQGGGAKAGR